MAANILPFRPAQLQASATSGNRKPDFKRQKSIPSGWWTPLFVWSSEPDYIDSGNNNGETGTGPQDISDLGLDRKPAKSRLSPGSFTDKKARKLRMLTTGTASHHGAMYHSAIATRLATDFSDRSDL